MTEKGGQSPFISYSVGVLFMINVGIQSFEPKSLKLALSDGLTLVRPLPGFEPGILNRRSI